MNQRGFGAKEIITKVGIFLVDFSIQEMETKEVES